MKILLLLFSLFIFTPTYDGEIKRVKAETQEFTENGEYIITVQMNDSLVLFVPVIINTKPDSIYKQKYKRI